MEHLGLKRHQASEAKRHHELNKETRGSLRKDKKQNKNKNKIKNKKQKNKTKKNPTYMAKLPTNLRFGRI